MLEPEEQLDRIAEYADASVRILSRRGSLVGVPGAYGLKRWLYRRYGNRGNAAYTALGSLFAIALSGFWAWLFNEPLLFPSLGATAFLFFETPLAEVGTPRNAIIGLNSPTSCVSPRRPMVNCARSSSSRSMSDSARRIAHKPSMLSRIA